MKKKLLCLLGIAALTFSLGACGSKDNGDGDGGNTPVQPSQSTFTVAFEVDGQRVATARVKDGEKVTDEIANPSKSGYQFVGWYEGETLVDLSTYVVTHNVVLTAHFEEIVIPQLNVDDVKDASKTYYLVLGWWECTDFQDDGVTPKLTSHLTQDTVRLFYANLINYLKTVGATDEQIAAISFRNYSSTTVALMGTAVNADADVDILIGVGNNINSTAGVTLHNSSNDYKFATNMGDPLTSRYVACTSYASELGVATYDWLKGTQAGKDAFTKVLTQAEIDASLVPETIDLTVTVHGDTDAVTHLQDKTTAITMPTITVPETHNFKGFALTATGEVVLNVAKDATLKYDDLKDLVAENANTLDLYPILEAKPVVLDDLVVYIQVQGTNLYKSEAELLEARFSATLPAGKKVKFNICEVSSAAAFTEALGDDADVVIGGNNPLNTYSLYNATDYPLANAGAKHFLSTNRKVIIRDTVAAAHVDLAVALYNFVIADATAFTVTSAFWHKNNEWVTEAERTAIQTGVENNLKSYLHLGDSDTLADKFNVSVKFDTCSSTKVADLVTETRALNEGKGVDLIIGAGGNEKDNMAEIIEMKDIPTTIVAGGRKVAIVHDHALARNIYDTYFTAE